MDPLIAVKDLYQQLCADPQEFDFMPPVLVSHAKAYAGEPERLRRYAKQVISARIMILLSSSRMTTQSLLEIYQFGLEKKRPFPLLLVARAQMELYAVVADTIRIIRENSGEHSERFVERVHSVDSALITASFGTRSGVIKDILGAQSLSRVRPMSASDEEALNSKNVLTRLQKLAKLGVYKDCLEDYERLCEFVHPNWGMNMMHLVPSPLDPRLLRFSRSSEDPFSRAVSASADALLRSARGTVDAFNDLVAPFGTGQATRL